MPTLINSKILPDGLTVQRMEFAVALTVPQMKKLLGAEYTLVERLCGAVETDDVLVDEIEFNGHFGAAFYFRVSAESVHAMTEAAMKVQSSLLDFLGGAS